MNRKLSLEERFKAQMKLSKLPARPTSLQLQNNGRNFPPNFLHESWRDYLYWDTELQS